MNNNKKIINRTKKDLSVSRRTVFQDPADLDLVTNFDFSIIKTGEYNG